MTSQDYVIILLPGRVPAVPYYLYIFFHGLWACYRNKLNWIELHIGLGLKHFIFGITELLYTIFERIFRRSQIAVFWNSQSRVFDIIKSHLCLCHFLMGSTCNSLRVSSRKPKKTRGFCRAMLCKRGLYRHAVSVCPYVTFVDSVKTNKNIFKIFSPSRNDTILVFFLYQRHGNIPVTLNAGGVGKNLDSRPVPGFIARYDRQVLSTRCRRTVASCDTYRW